MKKAEINQALAKGAVREHGVLPRIDLLKEAPFVFKFTFGIEEFLEVKRGAATAIDFAGFPRTFPAARLTVIGSSRFETDRIRGITVEDFLLAGD